MSLAGSLAIVVLLGVVAIHNAATYPSVGGYDAQEYITYARDLVEHGALPAGGVGAYYTPPGYMALAGIAGSLGRALDVHDPDHLGQLLNASAVVGTAVLVLLLARTLWPARPVTWLAAVGFFAFFPTVLKTGAMFHPEPLGMLITAGALLVLAHMVRARAYSWKFAVPLGLLLGAGQLVRAWSLWMVAVATIVLVAAALGDRSVRRSALGATAIALVLAAIVPAPWYVHQATHYSNPVFDRPHEDEFLLARRPLAFYVDARFPDIIRQPWQGAFNDRFLPVFYAETWGDYFGIWSWGPGRGTEPMRSTLRSRVSPRSASSPRPLRSPDCWRSSGSRSHVLARIPHGWSPRCHPYLHSCLVLYLAVAYPTSDGDTIKGTYALAAVPAFGLCFGFAVDVVSRHRIVGIALAIALVASALAELPFLVW